MNIFTNVSWIIGLMILSDIFIVDFSNLIHLPSSEISSNKNKEIKAHFAKMQFIEGRKLTLGVTSDFRVTEKDSTLFARGIPSSTNMHSYYISATEVTNAEWKEFYFDKVRELGKKEAKERFYPDTSLWITEFSPNSYNEYYKDHYHLLDDYKNHPVAGINWDQANSFCLWKTQKVNALLKKKKVKHQIDFRLPTQKEWTFAAMKTRKENQIVDSNKNVYSWGVTDMSKNILKLSNFGCIYDINKIPIKLYGDDGHLYTSKVGSFPPNDHNLYDIGGNVSEWTSDVGSTLYWKDSTFYTLKTVIEVEIAIQELKEKLITSPLNKYEKESTQYILDILKHDQKVLSKGDIKICKGGSWESNLLYTQCGIRQGVNKNTASSTIGFRIAMSEIPQDLIKYLPKNNWKPKN